MCKVKRKTHIKMIGAFKLLYTIIKDRIFLNRTWEETKKEIDGCVREDSVFKIVEPVVRKAMSDAGVVRQEFKG
jgi:hypothetical protein